MFNYNLKYNLNPIISDYLVNYMKYFLNNKIDFYKNYKYLNYSNGLIMKPNSEKPPRGTPLALILATATIFMFISKKL